MPIKGKLKSQKIAIIILVKYITASKHTGSTYHYIIFYDGMTYETIEMWLEEIK